MSKIIYKVISSVYEPDNTKAIWHNPETGQLKIFGNTGWQVIGGFLSDSEGYPIVTVEDNFNIEAKPNTFYDIKNDVDSEIIINFKSEEFNNTSITTEFIFNFISPSNITFNEEIKWNNDNAPDLTKTGIYTISILNGVGCFTFVNS